MFGLAHHLRISANIPMSLLLDWLQSLRADVIIEFVGREDEMTQKLLLNKEEQYADYNLLAFEEDVHKRFIVKDTWLLKDGMRKLIFWSRDSRRGNFRHATCADNFCYGNAVFGVSISCQIHRVAILLLALTFALATRPLLNTAAAWSGGLPKKTRAYKKRCAKKRRG